MTFTGHQEPRMTTEERACLCGDDPLPRECMKIASGGQLNKGHFCVLERQTKGAQVTTETTPLSKRLGRMADEVVRAPVGPRSRFFTRERVDEIVLLLREAEKHILEGRK